MANPSVQAVSPDRYLAGNTYSGVAVTGQNFASGASVAFSFAVSVRSTAVVSSTQIQVDIDVQSGADGGGDVTVTNPDDTDGTLSGAYLVRTSPFPPD